MQAPQKSKVEIYFTGLLAFHDRPDSCQVGVLRAGADHQLKIMLIEENSPRTTSFPRLLEISDDVGDMVLAVNKGTALHPSTGDLKKVLDLDKLHGNKGLDIRAGAFGPNLFITRGTFSEPDKHLVLVSGAKKEVTFTIEAEFEMEEGQVATLAPLNDPDNPLFKTDPGKPEDPPTVYKLFVSNLPPFREHEDEHEHFQHYYEKAFHRVLPGDRMKVKGVDSRRLRGPAVSFKRPCLSIILTTTPLP